jgi:uncharacterized BrkB/YihY/UPF0761 family membrane protein
LRNTIGPTIRLLFETEVHVYSFSIAANVLLSFFPFVLTMILICRWVFRWEAGVRAILYAVGDYFPDYRMGGYIDIVGYLNNAAWNHKGVSLLSIFLLFLTANGIFEPLEVALNRAWRVKKNRSYLRNQLVSLGMIFVCGTLVLLSTSLTAWNHEFITKAFGSNAVTDFLRNFLFRLIALPLTMAVIFLVYWLLPNRKIPVRRVLPASVAVGLLLEALKYIDLLTWPWLMAKLKGEEGPFVHSASIIVWAFFGAMIVLAGAEWAARVTVGGENPVTNPEPAQSRNDLLDSLGK